MIAIAHVQSFLSAISPNRVLHKAREVVRERLVEFLGIDPSRNLSNNSSAAVLFVTTLAVSFASVVVDLHGHVLFGLNYPLSTASFRGASKRALWASYRKLLKRSTISIFRGLV